MSDRKAEIEAIERSAREWPDLFNDLDDGDTIFSQHELFIRHLAPAALFGQDLGDAISIGPVLEEGEIARLSFPIFSDTDPVQMRYGPGAKVKARGSLNHGAILVTDRSFVILEAIENKAGHVGAVILSIPLERIQELNEVKFRFNIFWSGTAAGAGYELVFSEPSGEIGYALFRLGVDSKDQAAFDARLREALTPLPRDSMPSVESQSVRDDSGESPRIEDDLPSSPDLGQEGTESDEPELVRPEESIGFAERGEGGGLGDRRPADYEFFAPTQGTELGELLMSDDNKGVPGEDPYPRLNGDGNFRIMPGEKVLGSWFAKGVIRDIKRLSGVPDNWMVDGEGWLTEKLAGKGGVEIGITDRRILVLIPALRTYDQLSDRHPGYRRGEGEPVGLTATEQFYVPIVMKISRKGGALSEFVREAIGDFPPCVGHLPLQNVRGLSIDQSANQDVVTFRTEVDDGRGGAFSLIDIRLRFSHGDGYGFFEETRNAVADYWRARGVTVDFESDSPTLEIKSAHRIGSTETAESKLRSSPAGPSAEVGLAGDRVVVGSVESSASETGGASTDQVPTLSPHASRTGAQRIFKDVDDFAASMYLRIGGAIALAVFIILFIVWLGFPPHTTTTYEVAADGTMTQSTSPGAVQIVTLLAVALASACMFKLAASMDEDH